MIIIMIMIIIISHPIDYTVFSHSCRLSDHQYASRQIFTESKSVTVLRYVLPKFFLLYYCPLLLCVISVPLLKS